MLRTPVEWIAEREAIRLKKTAGEPKPWTTDPVLAKFRFCNVRREDDKVSLWLSENWYAGWHGLPPDDYWLGRVLMARWVNNVPCLTALKAAGMHEAWLPRAWNKAAVRYNTRAYCLPVPVVKNVGGKAGLLELMPRILKIGHPEERTVRAVYGAVTSAHGMGGFWGGQLALDCLMAYGGYSDEADFTSPGPGSKRGMKLVGEPGKFEHAVVALRDRWNDELAGRVAFRLRALDVEHVLCEWQKYNYLKERI